MRALPTQIETSTRQHKQGLSYRLIGLNLGLSKNTVMEIVKCETD